MPSLSFKKFKACNTKSKSVELSREISSGRKNGTSAPQFFDIPWYSVEFVLTIVLSILFDLLLQIIDQAIKGTSPKFFKFFPGTPFEPDLAGIIETIFKLGKRPTIFTRTAP
jgi:hypothetical protein